MICASAKPSVEFDERGDLLIRIPRARLLQDDLRRITQAIETVLNRAEPAETQIAAWENDTLLGLIGQFEAKVTDGSSQHDRDLYLRSL